MIAHLTGTVREWTEGHLVVDVGGVGYRVFTPLSTSAGVPRDGTASLYIHTQVREDAIQLFGFLSAAERDLFLLLIGVSGVGPKVALSALSALSVPDLVGAIGREDVTALGRIPGIGKKTASRVALELRDKVVALGVAPTAARGAVATRGTVTGGRTDAVSALVNLGYPRTRAQAAVAAVAEPGASVETLIREGLNHLSKVP